MRLQEEHRAISEKLKFALENHRIFETEYLDRLQEALKENSALQAKNIFLVEEKKRIEKDLVVLLPFCGFFVK